MIDRRAFVQGAALAAAAPLLGRARPAGAAHGRGGRIAGGRPPRVGVLGEADPVGWTLRTSLAEVEWRWAEGGGASLRDLAGDLLARPVDVIVAVGTAAARAAGALTATTPIVFVAGADPDRAGRGRPDETEEETTPARAAADPVEAPPRRGGTDREAAAHSRRDDPIRARSGGDRPGAARLAGLGDNATGVLVPSEAAIARRRLAILAGLAPGLERVAVLAHPDSATAAVGLTHLRAAAARLDVDVERVRAASGPEAEGAIARLGGGRRAGLVVLPDALFAIHARPLAGAAAGARLPALYPARSFVDAGGLAALSGDAATAVRRVAAVVARVLAGEPPASIPVETLAPPALAVSLAAARALGLALPRSLFARADAVVA